MTNILKVYKEYSGNYKQVSLNFKSGKVAKMYKNQIHTYTMGEENTFSVEETIYGIY